MVSEPLQHAILTSKLLFVVINAPLSYELFLQFEEIIDQQTVRKFIYTTGVKGQWQCLKHRYQCFCPNNCYVIHRMIDGLSRFTLLFAQNNFTLIN